MLGFDQVLQLGPSFLHFLLCHVLPVLVSPAPSCVPGLPLLCPWLPLVPELMHPNSLGSAWGKSDGVHCCTPGMASAFIQASALAGLEMNFREEAKHGAVTIFGAL